MTKTKKPISLQYVAELIDLTYARKAVLHGKGLHSFAQALKFAESFAESVEELEEYRRFLMQSAKNHAARDMAFTQWFNTARDEASARQLRTGNIWEGKLTRFEQRFWRLRAQNPKELRFLQQPYRDERESLWQEEVAAFSTELWQKEKREAPPRTALCIAIIEEYRSSTRLTLDSSLSTQASPVLSTLVADQWKVALHIDRESLKEPFRPRIYAPEIGEWQAHFIYFDPWLSIRPLRKYDDNVERSAAIMFEWLFPIREVALPPVNYRPFGSLREFEAVVRIHMEMFLLIREELEQALLQEPLPD
jgi:hypothetical protein